MNDYVLSSAIAFALVSMGMIALMMGGFNYKFTEKSYASVLMFNVCWCVLFWNVGYAWMSLCYDSDWAYVARSVALFAVFVYMIYIIRYAREVTNYPKKKLSILLILLIIPSLVSWSQIIKKDAVSFQRTPWGYWYTSSMTWARILQFVVIIACLLLYYLILSYGIKTMPLRRQKYVIKKFMLFGPILFTGYLFDTLFPVVFHTAAIPGSCISAFASAMVLFKISTDNRIFGLNKTHVSEYVYGDVNIPVIIADYKGKIVMANDCTTEMLGFSNEELVGNTLDVIIDVRKDNSIKIKNKEMVCELEQTDVKDKFDDLMYSIYFFHDVTKEREHIREIQINQRMAEKANKAKSEFLANMSHEIRTPINAVLGMDEMILRESKEEETLEYATNIKHAGTLLLYLINDILDFSKIETGKMELVPAEYEIASMINDLFIMSQDRAKKKGLSLDLNIDKNLPTRLFGDDVRLRQIITNLLTNAIKYTHKGSILFSVNKLSEENGNVKLRFSVKDTGIGIKEDDKKRMFEAFQRVDEDLNRSVEGTGLGLSITMSLLKLMDSELAFDSVYGEGSEFYFEVSQKIIDEKPIGEFHKISKKNKDREDYRVSFVAPEAQILVVDDNSMNIQIVLGLLKQTKVKITTANSGYESLKLVQKKKFDVILMDHMMPGMDGIQAVYEMQKFEDYPSKDAVIIALTANAVHGAKEMFLENGFDDFLSKPVDGAKLEKMLMQYLPKELVKENDEVEVAKELDEVKETNGLKDILNSLRISVEIGKKFCMDSEDFLVEMIQLYYESNAVDALNKYFNEKKYDDYRVKIHAVKSNSKNIGVLDLYEDAYKLEMAIKEGNIEYLENNHEAFIKSYQEFLDEIADAMEK